MADFLSHHIFCEEILPKLPVAAKKSILQCPVCFRWGAQGPDIFFFSDLILGSPLHSLGSKMHREKTDELFFEMFRAINHLTGLRRTIGEAYFYGFLCHYVLDSYIHPYVYCRQKQLSMHLKHLSPGSLHCKIESNINSALYKAKHNRHVTTFDIDAAYTLDTEHSAVIAVILHYAILKVYGEDIPTLTISKAFEQMRRTEKLLYTKSKFIYNSLCHAETVIGSEVITNHFKMQPPKWDCLNLDHQPWCNLWEPCKMNTESVPELLENASDYVYALTERYAAEFDSGWLLFHHFDAPFDNGNPYLNDKQEAK